MIAAQAEGLAGGEALPRRSEELEGRKPLALRREGLVRANRLLRWRLRLKAELAPIGRPPT